MNIMIRENKIIISCQSHRATQSESALGTTGTDTEEDCPSALDITHHITPSSTTINTDQKHSSTKHSDQETFLRLLQ